MTEPKANQARAPVSELEAKIEPKAETKASIGVEVGVKDDLKRWPLAEVSRRNWVVAGRP